MLLSVLLTTALTIGAYQASGSEASASGAEIIGDTEGNVTWQREAVQLDIAISGAVSDPIVVKGASTGPVRLIAPSDARRLVSRPIDSNTSVEKARTDAAAAAAGAVVSLAVVGAAGSISISEGNSGLGLNGGLVSSSAVIGPSTGAVVVAGPTAPPYILAAPEDTSSESTELMDTAEIISKVSEQSVVSTDSPVRVCSRVFQAPVDMSVGSASASPLDRKDEVHGDEDEDQSTEVSLD